MIVFYIEGCNSFQDFFLLWLPIPAWERLGWKGEHLMDAGVLQMLKIHCLYWYIWAWKCEQIMFRSFQHSYTKLLDRSWYVIRKTPGRGSLVLTSVGLCPPSFQRRSIHMDHGALTHLPIILHSTPSFQVHLSPMWPSAHFLNLWEDHHAADSWPAAGCCSWSKERQGILVPLRRKRLGYTVSLL